MVSLETASGITVRVTGGRTADRARWRGRGWRGKSGLIIDQLGEHARGVVGGPRGTAASLARWEAETLASWVTRPSGS